MLPRLNAASGHQADTPYKNGYDYIRAWIVGITNLSPQHAINSGRLPSIGRVMTRSPAACIQGVQRHQVHSDGQWYVRR